MSQRTFSFPPKENVDKYVRKKKKRRHPPTKLARFFSLLFFWLVEERKSMAESEPAPRVAYIRTTSSPDWYPFDLQQTLVEFVKQEDPCMLPPRVRARHHFLFGACNASDARILHLFVGFLGPPRLHWYFRHVQKTHLEVRVSRARAATSDGRRLLLRCAADEVRVVISGDDDDECNEIMLNECDYIIDEQTQFHRDWFFKTARPGVPQDSMLTNPEYDVSRHDYSKHRLGERYAGRGWRASSGAFHGNHDWYCGGCGGKCKRGRCKVTSYERPNYANQRLLPEKGSREWADMSSGEVVSRYNFQMAFGKHIVQKELRTSIDTFSGD